VIHDYLISNDNLTFEDVRDLALTVATTDSFGYGGNPWKFAKDYFAAAVQGNPTEDREDALTLLEDWDGHFVAGGESEWVSGKHQADAWVLMDAWIREAIRLTFEDELNTVTMIWEDPNLRWHMPLLFNVLLHGLAGESSGMVNNYNWFQNLSDQTAPQAANDIIVEALDNVLETLGRRPWGRNERGVIEHKHDIFGTVHTTPFSSRSTYAQCIEFDSSGPIRIESLFPMGESGNIFSRHFRSMKKLFDSFEHRSFPLFD
jgi:penicillin amidase